MNRTERLYALVDQLRARAPRTMTAAELARRFEVSTRTIERDLLALQEAGVPIWTQPGPGGGYGLNAETTLPPLNLTAAEAAAVAIALAATRATPFSGAGRSALTKVAGVLAASTRDTAARYVRRVRVQPGSESPSDPVVGVIRQALLEPVALALVYQDAGGRETNRVVEPAGLLSTRHGWYLVAWCRLRQAPRTFRLDRIVAVSRTEETISPRSLDSMLRDLPFETVEPSLP